MRATLPRHAFLSHEPDVGLVHEAGDLEGVPGGLGEHESLDLTVQVAVHEWEELVARRPVAPTAGAEQFGELMGKRLGHTTTRRVLHTGATRSRRPQ